MKRELPQVIRDVGFDFEWDERKVWSLDVPTEEMHASELTWHLYVPFLWSKPDGYYDVYPCEVINHPKRYPEEYARTLRADTTFPIDIMFWKEHWLILDGLHRLMKQVIEGKEILRIRKIPESAISLILKDQA